MAKSTNRQKYIPITAKYDKLQARDRESEIVDAKSDEKKFVKLVFGLCSTYYQNTPFLRKTWKRPNKKLESNFHDLPLNNFIKWKA